MLNPKQRAAVTFGDGAALVLAGPGSGKTHTLCRRVHYLMTKRGVPSEKILVITFTKVA
ncbi:MAG: UvrD-helicase domain-containing protein, partial [Lachnospiraceae bacterium]|nr:UvrD-helicase domain-containing protein [Lachnospiraceae bacterium]